MWFATLLLLGQPLDVRKTLDDAAVAENAQARKLLAQVVKHLRTTKDLPVKERQQVREQLARLIPAKATSQAEVLEVLGPDAAKTVARQILFRRYVEQWTYDSPLSLQLTFDCPLGQEPRLRRVALMP